MRISQIQIKNYRAFKGPHLIQLEKVQNLIVFGENGSGKTSLFLALKEFFDNVRQELIITDYPRRNFFVQDKIDASTVAKDIARLSEMEVKVRFQPDVAVAGGFGKFDFVWSKDSNEVHQLSSHGLDITKGFIDYKGLLQTYFLNQSEDKVNVFDFLVEQVLTDVKSIDGAIVFGEAWNNIKGFIETANNFYQQELKARNDRDRRAINKFSRLKDEELAKADLPIEEFNSRLTTFLPYLVKKANKLLEVFEANIVIDLDYAQVRYKNFSDNQEAELQAKIIDLTVKYFEKPREKHHKFLNEARLSAIAVSVYFASFLVNPQAGIKILALDDVLIGLDMANRLPVLDVLEKHFADYQIFLFTFDKFWYQTLQERFPSWKKLEFFTQKDKKFELTFAKEKTTLMQKAEEQIKQQQYESAANLLRSHYEKIIRAYCNHFSLPVPYSNDPKGERANQFLNAIKEKAGKKIRPSKALLSRCRVILNKYLRTIDDPTSPKITRIDLQRALDLIDELEILIDSNRINRVSSSEIIPRVQTIVNAILNPLSHGAITSITRAEIDAAYKVVKEFDKKLGKKMLLSQK